MTRPTSPARARSSSSDVRQLRSRSQTFQETMTTANMRSGLYQPDEHWRDVEVDGQDLHVLLNERRVDVERITRRDAGHLDAPAHHHLLPRRQVIQFLAIMHHHVQVRRAANAPAPGVIHAWVGVVINADAESA